MFSQNEPCAPTQPLASWEVFDSISLPYLTEIIATLKTFFCPHDLIHPQHFKLVIESVGPGLLSFLNKCLLTGSVPTCLKVATVTPFLKKPSLDTSILNNYHPISVVPFISKIMEKVVMCQLQSFFRK